MNRIVSGITCYQRAVSGENKANYEEYVYLHPVSIFPITDYLAVYHFFK